MSEQIVGYSIHVKQLFIVKFVILPISLLVSKSFLFFVLENFSLNFSKQVILFVNKEALVVNLIMRFNEVVINVLLSKEDIVFLNKMVEIIAWINREIEILKFLPNRS